MPRCKHLGVLILAECATPGCLGNPTHRSNRAGGCTASVMSTSYMILVIHKLGWRSPGVSRHFEREANIPDHASYPCDR